MREPYVAIRFESKKPHRTPWLSIEYQVDAKPEQLIADLAAIGWTTDRLLQPLCPMPKLLDGETDWSKAMKVTSIEVGRRGGGVFGDWCDDERDELMRGVKAVLAKHGFKKVPHKKLSLADMM